MKKLTSHHVAPQSRGKSKNTVMLPDTFHCAWHAVFQSLKPQEIELFIYIINKKMKEQEVIHQKEFNQIISDIKGGVK